MKVGAGGLQTYATHDEVASRQAQESRRPDYQPKPVNDSANTEALNRHALNKTVERPNDAAEAYDLPLRYPPKKRENGQGGAETRDENHENNDRKKSGSNKGIEIVDETNPFTGLKVDRYI